MYKRIIISILFVLISFPALSEEEKPKVPLTELNIVHPITCGSEKQINKIFKQKQLVFIGLMNNQNVIKIYLNDKQGFAILMENIAELSCIYFTGIPGLLQNQGAEKTRSELNGEYLYN